MTWYVKMALAVFLLAVSATPPASPDVTPVACDQLDQYMETVYQASLPQEVSVSEIGIARAAWGGPNAYPHMTRTELATAQFIYQAWGANMTAVSADEIPDGLNPLHEVSTRRIELHAEAITAYLAGDSDAYDDAVTEMWSVAEDAYLIDLEGVAQCGDVWIDVFGEPWDPSPDATPVATPRPGRR